MLFFEPKSLLLLAAALILFALCDNTNSRKAVLLAASVVFYVASGIFNFVILAAFIVINYAVAAKIARTTERQGEKWLVFVIVLNLMNLFSFKYVGFFAEVTGLSIPAVLPPWWQNLALPIGISFYTFQMIAYQVDVYRKDTEPARGVLEFATFILYFPQLIAGPIMRGNEMLAQFRTLNPLEYENLRVGAARFLLGFMKKVVVVNGFLGPRIDGMFGNMSGLSALELWCAIFLFGFQIFLDFSGYCDMAVGIARMFGVRLRENFNTPYLATSPSEFWRRWNITLSEWIRDYIYIPLGGSRGSLVRSSLNATIAMLLCGLWHGAAYGFVIWGGIHGLLIFAGRFASAVFGNSAGKMPGAKLLAWALTFITVQMAWLFFRVPEPDGFVAALAILSDPTRYEMHASISEELFLIGVLLVAHFGEYRLMLHGDAIRSFWSAVPPVARGIAYAVGIIVLTPFLIAGNDYPFIYFQF